MAYMTLNESKKCRQAVWQRHDMLQLQNRMGVGFRSNASMYWDTGDCRHIDDIILKHWNNNAAWITLQVQCTKLPSISSVAQSQLNMWDAWEKCASEGLLLSFMDDR